jgi:hypothetical protein
MSTYVELNDEGAARQAAQRLIELGSDLTSGDIPPTVEWGDDDYGDQMREAYYKPIAEGEYAGWSVPALALHARWDLAEKYRKLSEGLDKVVNLGVVQEGQNYQDITHNAPQ